MSPGLSTTAKGSRSEKLLLLLHNQH